MVLQTEIGLVTGIGQFIQQLFVIIGHLIFWSLKNCTFKTGR